MIPFIWLLCVCILAFIIGDVISRMYDRVSKFELIVWLGVVLVMYGLYASYILK